MLKMPSKAAVAAVILSLAGTSLISAASFEAAARDSGLVVAPEQRGGYKRDDWGPWAERVNGCMNMRHALLAARSEVRPRLTRDGCAVVEGRWTDAWTGQIITQAREIDVDHVVAVQEANDSGGARWPQALKERFYNDPDNLVITDKRVNQQKGALGPEKWLPLERSRACFYVKRHVAIKQKYQLTADRDEKAAIDATLDYCP